MHEREALRQALRNLLLPIDPALEDDALDALISLFDSKRLDPSEHALLLLGELTNWRVSGKPSRLFVEAVATILDAGNPTDGPILAGSYFSMIQRLQTEHSMSVGNAIELVSHLRLIAQLARDERMSGAQIARVLLARNPDAGVTWQAVHLALRPLGLVPTLSVAEMDSLLDRDRQIDALLFADADVVTAIERTAEIAAGLGFRGDLAALLSELTRPTARHGIWMPYVLMLHYTAAIAEFYDHALPYFYEFSPRGKAFQLMAEAYPPALLPNPDAALNNAKSVQVLDSDWAAAKKPTTRPQAIALATIIAGLDSMAFLARRELATWLRALILRLIAVESPEAFPFPDAPGPEEVRNLLRTISEEESRTSGIIEQRVVDAVAAHRHGGAWISRGVGDPVNASNVSRRKLGDCDFQDPATPSAIAYEAHAGMLSPMYVESHMRSLQRVIRRRIDEEWSRLGVAPCDWTVTVVFVATHLSEDLVGTEDVIEGVRVQTRFTTLASFTSSAPLEELMPCFLDHVHARLAMPRVPVKAKRVYAGLLQA